MAVDKTKLKEDLQKAATIGQNVLQTGASLAKSAAPVVGQVVNGGLGLVSALLGGKGSGSSTASYNTPYQQSQTVTDLQNQLNATTKPVQQQSQFQDTLQQTMDQILNKEKFTYDVNADALYNQYKDQYMAAGKTAMQDTMGQAAAMTGGYGNSYAQAVGQQQYQGYLQQLNDKIPELYQLARDSYDRDVNNLYNQYGLLSDAEAKEYSRYRDEVSDYYADRDYLTNRYYNEKDFDYNQWADNRDFSYQQHRDNIADEQWKEAFDREVYESDRNYNRSVYESDRNYDYQVGRDAVADSQWQQQFDRGVYESDRDYDYRVGRDAVSDAQWRESFDRSVYESDRDYNYTTSRAAASDAQWQKEYDLAAKKAYADIAKTNADAYATKQEAVALYGGSDTFASDAVASIDDFDPKTDFGAAGNAIYKNFTKRVKAESPDWTPGKPISDSQAISLKAALDSAANNNMSEEEYAYLIKYFGL